MLIDVVTKLMPKLPFKTAAFFLLLGTLWVFFTKILADPDFWFHMTVGREAILSGQIPDKSFYISGLLGTPENFYEWGFGALLYLTYSFFGEVGLSALNTALASFTVLILATQFWISADNKWAVLAATIAGLVVAIGMDARVTLRPENILFVAIAATIACLEIRSRTGNNKWLYPIPVIGFVMSNLHPSAIILVATVCCYLAQDIFKKRSWVAIKALLLTAIGTSAAAMITPFGPMQFFLPFFFAADVALTGQVVEFFTILTTPLAPAFVVIFLLGVIAFIPKPRLPNAIANGLLFLIFAILTLRYSRNIGLFAIAAFNPLSHLIVIALTRVESFISRKVAVGIASLVLASLIALLVWHRYTMHNMGLGFSKGIFPSYANEMRGQKDISAIASLFHFGGYLTWVTHKPVLVDGRNYSFNSVMQDHNDIFSRQPQWEHLLKKNHIDSIFTPALQPFRGTPVPLLGELYYSPNWKLCALDEVGLWFFRSDKVQGSGMNKELIWKRMNKDLNRKNPYLRSTDPVLRLSLEKEKNVATIPWPQKSEFCRPR